MSRVYTSCFYWSFSWYDLTLMIYWWRNNHLEVFYWRAKMWSRSFTQAIKYFNPKRTHVTSAHNLLANISHMTSSSHPTDMEFRFPCVSQPLDSTELQAGRTHQNGIHFFVGYEKGFRGIVSNQDIFSNFKMQYLLLS